MLNRYRKHIHRVGFVIYCIFCIYAFISAFIFPKPLWAKLFYFLTPIFLIPFTFGKYKNIKIQGYILAFLFITYSFISGYFQKNIGTNQVGLLTIGCISSFYHMPGILYFELIYIFIEYFIFFIFAPESLVTEYGNINNFLIRMQNMLFGYILLWSSIKIHLKTHSILEQRTQEAEIAAKAKGDFLANMSHEIRTPMNAIIGMAELILREDISNEVREFSIGIKSAGNNLITIINDILDFSKIESGKMEIIYSEYQPMSLLNDIINIINTRISDKDIEFIINADPNIPNKLMGDEVRLKQIIINLLNNAVKFTEKGAVTLNISSRKSEDKIILTVSVEDTGIGIKSEHLERLFVSFSQVNTRKNRNIEGTGLGLAICKQLVTLMHGFINVRSTYGKGSVFSFSIPQEIVDNTPSAALIDPSKYDILVLDNNLYNLNSIEKLLKNLKLNYLCCQNEDDFVSYLTQDTYSHLFIDYDNYLHYKDLLSSLSNTLNIVVMLKRTKNIKLNEQIKFIYKPIYCLPVISILRNVNSKSFTMQSETESVRFIAPKTNILVVDDNEVNLQVAIGLLKPYKMNIYTASSGKEALNMVQHINFDIVLMDHMMPEMDGIDTTKAIRALDNDYFKNLPIIALTANAVSGAKEMFLNAGMNDFVSKPIEIRDLISKLKYWLPRNKIETSSKVINISNLKNSQISSLELPEIKDLNVKQALEKNGGNPEDYIAILKIYFKNTPSQLERLEKYLRTSDWENYKIEVHGLKSASFSVGAENIGNLSAELEQAALNKESEFIEARHPVLIQISNNLLDNLKSFINKLLDNSNSEAAVTIQNNDIMCDLNSLFDAIDLFDSDTSIEIIDKLQAYSKKYAQMATMLEDTKEQIENFEYNDAKTLAQKIIDFMEVKQND